MVLVLAFVRLVALVKDGKSIRSLVECHRRRFVTAVGARTTGVPRRSSSCQLAGDASLFIFDRCKQKARTYLYIFLFFYFSM